jgi:RecB family exonuclease
MNMPIQATSRPPAKGFTAWSFSRYRAYTTCPLQAKLSMIDKLPQPASPAMDRGSSIHDTAAAYVKGEMRQLPEALTLFKDLFVDLRKRYETDVVVEDSWAFRRDWSVTTYDDWDNCWLRVKVDIARLTGQHIDILDWKTGKYSPQYNVADYELQLDLYSLGALLIFGDAIPDMTVSPHLVYLDHGVVHPEKPITYTLKDLPRLKKEWERRTAPMLNDRMFPPNPGQQCTWCAFTKAKGGPCPH